MRRLWSIQLTMLERVKRAWSVFCTSTVWKDIRRKFNLRYQTVSPEGDYYVDPVQRAPDVDTFSFGDLLGVDVLAKELDRLLNRVYLSLFYLAGKTSQWPWKFIDAIYTIQSKFEYGWQIYMVNDFSIWNGRYPRTLSLKYFLTYKD